MAGVTCVLMGYFMAERIDPELLLFLQKLPPEVRELLMQNFVNQKSRLVNDPMVSLSLSS